ncbi:MAG: hypothetical protein GY794_21830, partial [bacterium]|nr:hypothetical protein [bacterium]
MNMKRAMLTGMILSVVIICGSAGEGLSQTGDFLLPQNSATAELFTR